MGFSVVLVVYLSMWMSSTSFVKTDIQENNEYQIKRKLELIMYFVFITYWWKQKVNFTLDQKKLYAIAIYYLIEKYQVRNKFEEK